MGEAPMGCGSSIIECFCADGVLRCSRKQSWHMNSLHSKQRIAALTSHQPQLMLELFDSGDSLGLRVVDFVTGPMGPMLKSPCVSSPPRKLLIKKSVRGGGLLRGKRRD